MTRTNWSKVEDLVTEGIHRMNVERLNDEALAAQEKAEKKKGSAERASLDHTEEIPKLEAGKNEEIPIEWQKEEASSEEDKEEQEESRTAIIASVHRTLRWLWKQDRKIFEKLGKKRKSVKRMLDKGEDCSDLEWVRILQFRHKINAIKTKMEAERGITSLEDLIQSERDRHLNKRFNVNEKWLPLK